MTTTPRAATLIAAAAAALLAACGTSTSLKETAAPVESRTPVAAKPATAATAPANTNTPTPTTQSQVTTVNLAPEDAPPGAKGPRVVYFDFDSFVIKDEFKPMIEANAKALAAARGKKITIEGHTDERGGSEYNLALGQKRAEAVARSLALLGVQESQVEAVSFGKERPADTGHDEAAWAKNRRAELKDR